MVGIELRQATPADAAAIRSLTRAAYAKWVALIGREPKPMTADYEVTLRQHRFDLLLSGGVPAALIETVEEDGQLLIENVAVAPRFQRQGFGRMLLAHAERLARDRAECCRCAATIGRQNFSTSTGRSAMSTLRRLPLSGDANSGHVWTAPRGQGSL
jgi:ribosomal protein S18 acetylase RimI-like enzyme